MNPSDPVPSWHLIKSQPRKDFHRALVTFIGTNGIVTVVGSLCSPIQHPFTLKHFLHDRNPIKVTGDYSKVLGQSSLTGASVLTTRRGNNDDTSEDQRRIYRGIFLELLLSVSSATTGHHDPSHVRGQRRTEGMERSEATTAVEKRTRFTAGAGNFQGNVGKKEEPVINSIPTAT